MRLYIRAHILRRIHTCFGLAGKKKGERGRQTHKERYRERRGNKDYRKVNALAHITQFK